MLGYLAGLVELGYPEPRAMVFYRDSVSAVGYTSSDARWLRGVALGWTRSRGVPLRGRAGIAGAAFEPRCAHGNRSEPDPDRRPTTCVPTRILAIPACFLSAMLAALSYLVKQA